MIWVLSMVLLTLESHHRHLNVSHKHRTLCLSVQICWPLHHRWEACCHHLHFLVWGIWKPTFEYHVAEPFCYAFVGKEPLIVLITLFPLLSLMKVSISFCVCRDQHGNNVSPNRIESISRFGTWYWWSCSTKSLCVAPLTAAAAIYAAHAAVLAWGTIVHFWHAW